MIIGKGGWGNLFKTGSDYRHWREWTMAALGIVIAFIVIGVGVFGIGYPIRAANRTPDFANCSNDQCCPDPATHYLVTELYGAVLNHDDDAAEPIREWCVRISDGVRFPAIHQDDLARKVGQWIATTN